MDSGSHISDFIYFYPGISAKTNKQSGVLSLPKQSAPFVATGGGAQSSPNLRGSERRGDTGAHPVRKRQGL